MIIMWIIIAVVALVLIMGIAAYNRFVTFKNRAEEAWADIDVQLKRRYDLIPNLVSTVKGYASHEAGTLEAVTAARNSAMQSEASGDPKAIAASENMLAGTLKSLFALSENYPDLKANTNFLELQRELSDTENKIQSARRFYNANVRDMNTAIETFPSNIVARMFGFTAREFFELEAGSEERENVKVAF